MAITLAAKRARLLNPRCPHCAGLTKKSCVLYVNETTDCQMYKCLACKLWFKGEEWSVPRYH